MGQAKQRGTFEQRKAEAIKAGRTPEARKQAKLAEASMMTEVKAMIRAKLFKIMLRAANR